MSSFFAATLALIVLVSGCTVNYHAERSEGPNLAIGSAARVEWLSSYDQALKRARSKNRPMLVYFWASWCTWCRKMEAEVAPDAEVAGVIATKFVPVKLDIDRRENAMYLAKYMVRGTPTFVVVNGQEEVLVGKGGRPSGYHLGAMEQHEFLEFLRAFVGQ